MKKHFLITALAFPVILLGVVMGYHICISSFDEVEIAATGYDPRDILAGHYLNLQLDWDKTDCAQFSGNICPKSDFDRVYNFYISQQSAEVLEQAVNNSQNDVRLIFSYRQGIKPQLNNMKINGISYKKFIEEQNGTF